MISLSTCKEHLRIPADVTDEDAYILVLAHTAAEYVTKITGYTNDETAPLSYDAAAHLLMAHLYSNREAVSDVAKVPVPMGFNMLLNSLRPGDSLI